MTDIKRGTVPWKRPKVATNTAELQQATQTRKVNRPRWEPLDAANAVAFKGNSMTGESIDDRKDLPPFGYNPPPQQMLTDRRRRKLVLPKYARPAPTPKHPSAKDPVSAFFDPALRDTALLQRKLNTSKLARKEFAQGTGLTVIRDGRADGTITAYPTENGVGVSTGAMTAGGSPTEGLYAMLEEMERSVMAKAAAVWEAQMQNVQGSANFLGLPFGPAMDLFNSGSMDSSGFLMAAVSTGGISGAMGMNTGGLAGMGSTAVSSGAVGTATAPGGGSIDIKAQKVALAIQRMNQMYSVVANVFSKYHDSANQALNNLKG